jgi:hypothetical protein
MIYFLAADELDLVKIGYAGVCVEARIGDIQVASPAELRLIGCVSGSRLDEKAVHHAISKFRRRGEWFEFGPAMSVFADASEHGVTVAIDRAVARTAADANAIKAINDAGSSHFRAVLPEIVKRLSAKFGGEQVCDVMSIGRRQLRNVIDGKSLPEAWRLANLRSLDPSCRVKVVMSLLSRAAEDGARCPNNPEIAYRIGAGSPASAARSVALLETMGLITVERGHMSRVVTIVATGKRTAGAIKHSRIFSKRVGMRKRYQKREINWTANDDALLMERVSLGDDFEQAAAFVGKTGDVAAARFDHLAARMGWQAC